MPNDSSKPPGTDPSRLPPVPGNAALRAVLTGISIDLCGSVLLDMILRSLYVAQAGTPGMTSDQVRDLARSMPPQSPLSVLGILLGALISVVAGYVCARIARRGEFLVGGLMAAALVILDLMLFDTSGDPGDLLLLELVTSVACNLLGVKYGAAQNRRLEAPADPPVDAPAP
jgi:hypothetical protein